MRLVDAEREMCCGLLPSLLPSKPQVVAAQVVVALAA